LNDISTHYSVGLFWVPEHSGLGGNKISDELPTEGTVYQSTGPKLAVGLLEAEYKQKYKRLDGQPAYDNVV
jgi:ribonuclease HI